MLVLAPVLIVLQLSFPGVINPLGILVFAFFYSVLYLFVNRDNLKKDEISYLEKEAKFRIENNRSEWENYFFILLIPISQFLYLDFNQYKLLFLANSLLVILIIGFIGYKYWKGKYYFVEKLFLTDTQFVFLGRTHIVINKENIDELKISGNRISIKEKHGNFSVELENLAINEANELRNQLKNFKDK